MTAATPTISGSTITISIRFNPALLPPPSHKPSDSKTEKIVQLEMGKRKFTRNEGITFEVWNYLEKSQVLDPKDYSIYTEIFAKSIQNVETSPTELDRFHEALRPYIEALDPNQRRLSVKIPQQPIRLLKG